MKIKSDGSLIFFVILIVVFSLASGKAERKAYNEGYAAAQEEYENYEEHIDSCDGNCDHVQNEIENLIYDDVLIYRDAVFEEDDIFDEDDMFDSYWEGAYNGYIQGYGDCRYGNKRELDISEYKNEDMF